MMIYVIELELPSNPREFPQLSSHAEVRIVPFAVVDVFKAVTESGGRSQVVGCSRHWSYDPWTEKYLQLREAACML